MKSQKYACYTYVLIALSLALMLPGMTRVCAETGSTTAIVTGNFNSWIQPGIRVGAIAPGSGIVLDLTTLPMTITESYRLTTRLSYGLVNGNDRGGGVLYANEILSFNQPDMPLNFYLGAGLNKPSKTNSDFGFNLFLGLDNKTSIFQTGGEVILFETGINNYSVPDFNKTNLNVLLGYRRLL